LEEARERTCFCSAVRKLVPLAGAHRLQFRLEAFTVLNHPNWNGASSNPTSGSLFPSFASHQEIVDSNRDRLSSRDPGFC